MRRAETAEAVAVAHRRRRRSDGYCRAAWRGRARMGLVVHRHAVNMRWTARMTRPTDGRTRAASATGTGAGPPGRHRSRRHAPSSPATTGPERRSAGRAGVRRLNYSLNYSAPNARCRATSSRPAAWNAGTPSSILTLVPFRGLTNRNWCYIQCVSTELKSDLFIFIHS